LLLAVIACLPPDAASSGPSCPWDKSRQNRDSQFPDPIKESQARQVSGLNAYHTASWWDPKLDQITLSQEQLSLTL
jgi:hypothetical protein